jgi:hypothetical protein
MADDRFKNQRLMQAGDGDLDRYPIGRSAAPLPGSRGRPTMQAVYHLYQHATTHVAPTGQMKGERELPIAISVHICHLINQIGNARGGVPLIDDFAQAGLYPAAGISQERSEKLVTRSKVMADGRVGDLQFRGHRSNLDRRGPTGAKQVGGCVQDHPLRLVGVSSHSGH